MDSPVTEGSPAPEPKIEALCAALEAVLFASPEPLSLRALGTVFGVAEDESSGVGGAAAGSPGLRADLETALALLVARTAAPGRGVILAEVAGGWQFLTRDEHFAVVQKVARTRAEEKLSPAVIETLSVVAYKQPVTRAEVDAIRGAQSGPHLRTLMDKGLVRVAGRADLPGAPFTYGTTKHFLKHFGLKSTKDLPDPKDLARLLAEQGRSAAEIPS